MGNHFYFYGQIDFIFQLSENNIQKFEEYLEKLSVLFSENNVSSTEYILQCLFFAFDDTNSWLELLSAYRYKFYKSSITNSRERNENWRILFDVAPKRGILKDLLDNISCELDDIHAFIKSKKTSIDKDNWKYLILDEPSILKYCDNALYTMSDEYNIRLLEKTLNSSRQRELRSFYWFKKLKTVEDFTYPPFAKLEYFTGERGNLNPCLTLTDWFHLNVNYYLDCNFNSTSFTLKLGRRSEGKINDDIVNALIKKHSFVQHEDVLLLEGISFLELENTLQMVTTSLNLI